tara:strand:+ start:137 stop:520 length:384 start_codon:yes stop_codon:yes gene_type:complete
MAFKLGREKRGFKTPQNTTLFKKEMEDGSLAQANMDGSIDVDVSVNLDSKLGERVIKHEMAHQEQIASGRAAYGDEWVMWEGNIYLRKEEDGVPVIDGPNGRWPEGDPHHPWEAEAIEAEKNNNLTT